jgi:hypothetical protein
MTTFPPQHPEVARTAAAVEAFYTRPRPIEVAFSRDVDPAMLGRRILELAWTGRAVIDLTLCSDADDVLRLVTR